MYIAHLPHSSKMYSYLLFSTLLRRTTEYAIEMTAHLSWSHYKIWSLPLFFQYKLFAYRRFTFNNISAGQTFRKLYTLSIISLHGLNTKPIFCLTTRWPKQTQTNSTRVGLNYVATRKQMYSSLFVFFKHTSFYSYVTALVKLCNTVNRIGFSLFTQTVCESNQPAWI